MAISGERMSPRERLLRTLEGEPVDRAPVYAQVPFALTESGMIPGAFHGYDDYDNWRERDPAYQKLVRQMASECDNAFIWRPPCMQNDQFFIPQDKLDHSRIDGGERIREVSEVSLSGAKLRRVREVKPGSGHSWEIEHYCKSADDARRLLDEPWIGTPVEADDFYPLQSMLGELGIIWVTIPSPIMAACRLFDPMQFLILCRSEEDLIERLMAVAQERIKANLSALIELGVGPVIRFGGAEHATPPLMSPEDFDNLVVGYDTPLVELCHDNGLYVAYHCHGNIRHALGRFREMGVNQTDPAEASPDGDVTAEEAREIAGTEMVLAGNIQCRELFSTQVTPETIQKRVIDFIEKAGPERIIVTTTGTPLEPIEPHIITNYGALFRAAHDFFR